MDTRTHILGDSAHHERVGRIVNEFLEQRAAGVTVREHDLFAKHPELAPQLRDALAVAACLAGHGDHLEALLDQGVLRRASSPDYPAALGRYLVRKVLGRGGMGIVLEAHEPDLERTVALKILRPELASDPVCSRRFQLEAQAAAGVEHRNIITIFAVGEDRGVHYVAMEHLAGGDLTNLIRAHGPLSTERCRSLYRQILAGLEAAHACGLIHRDIKPSNILLSADGKTAKIVDFGLARSLTRDTKVTLTNSVLGTPEYMSPEQVRGERDVDQRTDLYSTGVVLYEMLTGRSPFRADSHTAVMHRILHETPEDPARLVARADSILVSQARRLLAKRREDRFDLARVAREQLDANRPVTLPEVGRQRWRWVSAAMLTWLAVCLSAAVTWLIVRDGASHAAPVRHLTRVGVNHDHTQIVGCYDNSTLDEILTIPALAGHPGHYSAASLVPHRTDPLIIVSLQHPLERESAALVAYDKHLTERWRLDGRVPDWQYDADFCTYWAGSHLAVGDVDGRVGDEVVATEHCNRGATTRVSLLDAHSGALQARFWHPGHLGFPQVIRSYFDDADGVRAAIVMSGVNNRLDQPISGDGRTRLSQWDKVAVVVILDPLHMDGLCPPVAGNEPVGMTLPWAYACLDQPADQRTARTIDGDEFEAPERLAPLASVGIRAVSPQSVLPLQGRLPWLTVAVESTSRDSDGLRRNLILDRDLSLCTVELKDTDGILTRADWAARWIPLIQRGQPVHPLWRDCLEHTAAFDGGPREAADLP